jgi:hypothetical protein
MQPADSAKSTLDQVAFRRVCVPAEIALISLCVSVAAVQPRTCFT